MTLRRGSGSSDIRFLINVATNTVTEKDRCFTNTGACVRGERNSVWLRDVCCSSTIRSYHLTRFCPLTLQTGLPQGFSVAPSPSVTSPHASPSGVPGAVYRAVCGSPLGGTSHTGHSPTGVWVRRPPV